MYYTLDEGLKWHRIKLPRLSKLAQMTQQLEALGTSFLLMGQAAYTQAEAVAKHEKRKSSSRSARGSAQGLVIFVDFGGVKQRRCVGEKWAGRAGSDFENWDPRAGLKGLARCLNGHKTRYVRRMRMNDCAVHIGRKLLEHEHHCRCTVEDYECRRELGTVCVAPADALSLKTSDLCHHKASSSSVDGYFLTDSDTCKPGAKLPSKPTQCKKLQSAQPLPGVRDVGIHGGTHKHSKLTKQISDGAKFKWSTILLVGVLFSAIVVALALVTHHYLSGRSSAKVAEYDYHRVGEPGTLTTSAFDDSMEEVEGPSELPDDLLPGIGGHSGVRVEKEMGSSLLDD